MKILFTEILAGIGCISIGALIVRMFLIRLKKIAEREKQLNDFKELLEKLCIEIFGRDEKTGSYCKYRNSRITTLNNDAELLKRRANNLEYDMQSIKEKIQEISDSKFNAEVEVSNLKYEFNSIKQKLNSVIKSRKNTKHA